MVHWPVRSGSTGFSVDGGRRQVAGELARRSHQPVYRRGKLKRQVAACNRGALLDLCGGAVEFCMTTDHATLPPRFGASFYHSTQNYKRR